MSEDIKENKEVKEEKIDELQVKQIELDELNDRYKRVLAEFENFKKRSVPPPSSTHTKIIMIGSSNLSTSLSLPQLIVPNHPRPPVLVPAHRYSLVTHM